MRVEMCVTVRKWVVGFNMLLHTTLPWTPPGKSLSIVGRKSSSSLLGNLIVDGRSYRRRRKETLVATWRKPSLSLQMLLSLKHCCVVSCSWNLIKNDHSFASCKIRATNQAWRLPLLLLKASHSQEIERPRS